MRWIAHRGAAKSNPRFENTLAAFQRCADQVDGIELDVHLTEDREVIVVHDPELGGIPISSLTWPVINTLYPSIPRLGEVIEWLQSNSLLLYLEIKPGYIGIIPVILRIISPILNRVTIISFSRLYLDEISRRDPSLPLIYLVDDYLNLPPQLPKNWWIGISYKLLEEVDISFYSGVNVWTVNSIEIIQRCRELGVKSITSDFLPFDLLPASIQN